MEPQDFSTSIIVTQTPEKMFHAINNVRGWWSENIEGETDKINSEFTHRDKYLLVTFKIIYLTHRKIIWEVKNSYCNKFPENLYEWENTKIIFEITPQGNQTEIKFTHLGLVPQFECYKICSRSWDYFINSSLKELAVKGKGTPISTPDASFTTSLFLNKTPEEVYRTIKEVRSWWLSEIEGETDKLNSEFKFFVDELLQFRFKIIEMIPYKRIAWQVIEQNFRKTDLHEWVDTTILFDILIQNGSTVLRFTHLGLVPTLECYGICSSAWTQYIQISLMNFINNGAGNPNKW